MYLESKERSENAMSRKDVKAIAKGLTDNKKEAKEFEKLIKKLLTE